MSVNGSGIDRKSSKPISDSSSWTVRLPHGPILKDSKHKDLKGLNASDAFAVVRSFRKKGTWAVAVRS